MIDISLDRLPYGSEGLCPHCTHANYCEKSTIVIGLPMSCQHCDIDAPIFTMVNGTSKYPKKKYEFKIKGD